MSRRSGLGRLLLRYVVALRGVLALTATLVVVLVFFASAAPAALANLLTDAQRHALVEIPPASRDLVDEQQITPPPELVADDWRGLRDRLEKTRAELPPLLRSVTEPAAFTLTAATRKAVAATPGGPLLPTSYVNVTLSPDMPRHVTMLEGTLPRTPAGERSTADLVLSRAAAEEMRWTVGDVRVLTGGGLPDRRYRLSGTYDAVAPEGPFWRQTSGGIAPVVTTATGDRALKVEEGRYLDLGRYLATAPDDGRAWLQLGRFYLYDSRDWHLHGHRGEPDGLLYLDFAATALEAARAEAERRFGDVREAEPEGFASLLAILDDAARAHAGRGVPFWAVLPVATPPA